MNDLIDYVNALINTAGNLDLLTISISESATRFDTLNGSISDFIENLNRLNIPVFTQTSNAYAQPESVVYKMPDTIIAESAKKEKSLAEKAKPYAEAAGSLKKIATQGVKVYETFSKLPHALETFKKGTEFLSGGVETFEKVSKLTDKNAETSEKVSAALGIVATIAEVAAVAAPLTPVGWAFGAGAIIAGSISALVANNSAPDEPKKTFADEAVKNRNSYVATVDSNTDNTVEIIRKAEDPYKSPQQIAYAAKKLSDQFLKQTSLQFDDEMAGESPVYLQAFVAALNKNDTLKTHPIKEVMFRADEDRIAFQQRFDKMARFPLATMPAVIQHYNEYEHVRHGSIILAKSRLISQKQADQPKDEERAKILKATDEMLQTYVQSYQTNGKNYVLNAHNDFKGLISKAFDWMKYSPDYKIEQQAFARFDKIEKTLTSNNQMKGVSPDIKRGNHQQVIEPQSGRTININLNKPMIEHFTINAKEMKDGISDFKHKVEEVLLEILNSANAIQ